MEHTKIPDTELALFDSLKDVKVVFDVGTRVDVDYIQLKPDIALHAFEPNPEFFIELQDKIGHEPNIYLNNFGLSDSQGEELYNIKRQCFVNGEEKSIRTGEMVLPLQTLDQYAASHSIEQIDFLKIDTEGYDFKVLLGGVYTLPKCRYIQYEYWNDRLRFHSLLEQGFQMTYIGGRNVFCVNKTI